MGIECRKCADKEFYLQQRGMQVGAYCKNCGSWVKWVGKKEIPILRNRGAKIYPEDAEITLKRNENLGGVETELYNMGVTIEKIKEEKVTNVKEIKQKEDIEIPWKDDTIERDKIIEKEVQKRVAREIEKINQNKEKGEKEEDYCPICAGLPIEMEEKSKVDMVLYSDVLTITDLSGVQVLGFWRLKYCPNCGRKLNKGE